MTPTLPKWVQKTVSWAGKQVLDKIPDLYASAWGSTVKMEQALLKFGIPKQALVYLGSTGLDVVYCILAYIPSIIKISEMDDCMSKVHGYTKDLTQRVIDGHVTPKKYAQGVYDMMMRFKGHCDGIAALQAMIDTVNFFIPIPFVGIPSLEPYKPFTPSKLEMKQWGLI